MPRKRKRDSRLYTTREAAFLFSREVLWFRDHYRFGRFRWPDGKAIEPDRVDDSHPVYLAYLWSIPTLMGCAESLLRYGRMTQDHHDLVMKRLELFLPGAK